MNFVEISSRRFGICLSYCDFDRKYREEIRGMRDSKLFLEEGEIFCVVHSLHPWLASKNMTYMFFVEIAS